MQGHGVLIAFLFRAQQPGDATDAGEGGGFLRGRRRAAACTGYLGVGVGAGVGRVIRGAADTGAGTGGLEVRRGCAAATGAA